MQTRPFYSKFSMKETVLYLTLLLHKTGLQPIVSKRTIKFLLRFSTEINNIPIYKGKRFFLEF